MKNDPGKGTLKENTCQMVALTEGALKKNALKEGVLNQTDLNEGAVMEDALQENAPNNSARGENTIMCVTQGDLRSDALRVLALTKRTPSEKELSTRALSRRTLSLA